ncbi:hypothetical protein, variant 1 [Aphanomyces astaci]|uniref:Uncharacterized protein n=1 Tax=Aphanomyces astaci TaxID=112090 RepID=W4H0Q7_APHAT|nr:hypothetical protein, variant 1 [Aphanomyces astaci]ETV85151.1 hypothetical protein, variant 1 [Aphanomyces astaci]|eukprot:XP_009825169.1 hypothetical protein, variant 1 [Aphanomyces astaci]
MQPSHVMPPPATSPAHEDDDLVETSTASSFQPNHCIECCMSFDSTADFANHKAKFCIQSEYFDPVKMQQHLLATSISDESNVMATKGVCGATMSFAKVEQYLSGGGGRSSRDGNGTGQDMTIGKVSLLDLKATMQANDVEMEKLRRHVKKEREKEKADELRGLKLKQQKALLQKKQEEDEVVALMKEIERRQVDELKARAKREQVKAELRHLDTVGMNLLEDERKRELAELVKQKEILTQKEQAALHEIQALEKRVKDQELQHRDDERKVLATIQRMDDGSKGDARVRALRATHMQRSQTYGAQAALLGHKRMELQQLQEKLKNDMTNLDVRHTRGDNQADDDNAAAGVISFNYDEEKHRVKNFDGQFGGDIKGHETSSPATDSSSSKQPHSSSVRDVGKSNSKSTADDSPSPNNWNDEPKPTPRRVHSSDLPTREEERGNTKPLKDNAKTPTAPAPLDALEREVLHRNESDHTLKQSRPSTPRIAKAPQAPPMNHPPLHGGNLPSSSYPPSINPEAPPYAVPPMASHMWPPPNYTSYGGAYPYFAPPPMSNYGMLQPPYFNGYTGFAATGAAIMGGGYPPPMMNPYGMQPTPYMQHQPMSMMPNMMMNPGMFEPPPDPETVKLQQQLEAMKQLKEQRELEMETLRFQQMIQSIQGKLPGAANGLFTNAPTGQQQSMSAQSSSSDLAPKIALAVADELESKELKALKLKHAEDMLKLKQQRDLMEEEERLQDMKEQREKRRREMDEQMAQEEWMANQKRMVMALRMKKVLAQEQPLAPSMTDDMAASGDVRPYDPELGFSVFWDYILLVPAKASFLQVTYAVYEGSILRTKHKVIRARECEPHGPTVNRCVLASTRAFDHLPANMDVRLLIEVAATTSDGKTKPLSLGWTAMDLFILSSDGSTVQLQQGKFKLPLSRSPLPSMNNGPWSVPKGASDATTTTLYLRVAHAAQVEDATMYPVNPDVTASKYQNPSTTSTISPSPTLAAPTTVTSDQTKKSSQPTDPLYHAPPPPTAPPTRPPTSKPAQPITTTSYTPNATSTAASYKSKASPIRSVLPSAMAVLATIPSISGDHGTAQYTALLSALRPSDPKEWTHSSSDCVQLVLSLPSSSVPLYSSEDRSIDPSTGLVTAGPWKIPLFSVPKPLSHNQPIVITLSHKRSGGVVELYSATLALEDAGGHDVVWDEQLVELCHPATKQVKAIILVTISPTDHDPPSHSMFPSTSLSSGEGWVECDLYSNPRNIPPQTLFGRGDGFNVYVDGLRSLPDPVTISKVTCFALNADMTSVSPLQEPSAYTTLQDNASSPSFKLCLEYRGDRFNPTLTLLCRVDTIHGVSKQPMVVGYAALPLFVEHRDNGGAAMTAPTKATVQEFCLNTGAFQLPLRLGATLGTNEIDFSATACDGYMKLPCATILVRVCPAAKTEDGLACLSRNDVATSDWIARGVSTPAPNYADKAYDSTASRPSLAEDKLYKLRLRRPPRLVGDTLLTVTDKATVDAPEKLATWLQAQLTKKPTVTLLDTLTTMFPYIPEMGFRIAIDGLVNVPSGCLYKVVTCISPPAPFYQDPKMTDDVHMTISYNWTSAQAYPEFQDGYITFRDVPEFPNTDLLVVFDVRGVKQVKGTWVSHQVGWAYLKLLNTSHCIAAGSFQLPLFSGAMSLDLLQHDMALDALIDAETAKKKGLISYLPGMSLCIRVEDGCMPNTFPKPLVCPVHKT